MFQLIVTVTTTDEELFDLCQRYDFNVDEIVHEEDECTGDPTHDIVPGAPYCPQCGETVARGDVTIINPTEVLVDLINHLDGWYQDFSSVFPNYDDPYTVHFVWQPLVETDFFSTVHQVVDMDSNTSAFVCTADEIRFEVSTQLVDINDAAKQIRAKVKGFKKSLMYKLLTDAGTVGISIGLVTHPL